MPDKNMNRSKRVGESDKNDPQLHRKQHMSLMLEQEIQHD
jgi:hypothetical protein